MAAFYPEEGLSKMQRLNLTVMSGERVYVAGVSDNFDVCQHLAHRILCSEKFGGELKNARFTRRAAILRT